MSAAARAGLAAALLLCGASAGRAQVPYERIRNAASEPHNWLTYSGQYNGHRHSPLAQIHPGNVAGLRPLWLYQVPGGAGARFETSPIVVDGLIYLTEKPHVVTALDARSGRPVWRYTRPPARDVPGCCGPVNRGLAIHEDALFFTSLDAHLVALDLHTGRMRWEAKLADSSAGYSSTAAPLVVKDKVIVGIAGGEFGIRGFVDAYDVKSGRRLWRFMTVPGPGEPGHATWAGESWKTGGAATWVTGSYDPELNLVYWGTGNPAPDYNGDERAGDNLYSNCLLALDADSGALRWHFQFTPHDLHDWDSNQVPVLLDARVNGGMRKAVAQGNRNGFFYLLDRLTGEFLLGMPYIKQTWADGLDERGRPRLRPGMEPSATGTLVYPGLAGGTNWFSPAYSPLTGLFYLQAREDYAQLFYKVKAEHKPGVNFEGGGTRDVDAVQDYGVVKAIEPATGAIRWEFKLHAAASGGVLTTGGGLVFSGNREGYFFALDAESGRLLWRFQTGGPIFANPIGFAQDGRQRVAIPAGSALFVFGLE